MEQRWSVPPLYKNVLLFPNASSHSHESLGSNRSFVCNRLLFCWGSHPEVHCYSGYRRSVKQSHDPRAVYYTRRLAINLPCRHCVNTAVIMHCRPGLLCLLKTGWSCTVQFHLLCCGTDFIDGFYVFIPCPCVRYVGKHVWLFWPCFILFTCCLKI